MHPYIETTRATSILPTTRYLHPSAIPGNHIVARSAVTIYPTVNVDPTSTLIQSTTGPPITTGQPPSPPSSSIAVPQAAFWAVLGALILLVLLGALAHPISLYRLRGRHKNRPVQPQIWPGSSSSHSTNGQQQQQWSTFPPSSQPQPQQFFPQQMQQMQVLSQLQAQAPIPTRPSDPNRRALLARLAALNNPSILGAIPEDSTVLTSSSTYPGNSNPVVNKGWANIKERRLQEAKEKGEVVEMEVATGELVGGKGKRVRFREREWAILASDGGASRLQDVTEEEEKAGKGVS